jgi:hypothetical protein
MASSRQVSIVATAFALTAACANERARVEADTGRGAPAAARAAPDASQSAASLPYYLDASEGCGLLKTALFPEPVPLVQHYVTLDHDARFLQTDPATDSVYVCPDHLPGPDEFTVVTRSDVEPLSRTDSVANDLVRSQRLGTMTQDSVGFVFVRDPGVVVDTFVVLHTPFGWRIESPQLPDRVLGSAVLADTERFHLRPAVRDSLVAAMSRPEQAG